MWAPNEAAQKAGNGTHIAIRIDNLRFDEGSDDKPRVDLMVGSLTTVGMGMKALRAAIRHLRWANAGSREANPPPSDCDHANTTRRCTTK